MYPCSHQPRAVARRRDGSRFAVTALFSALIFAIAVMPTHAADPPAPRQADMSKSAASQLKPSDTKAKPFLEGGLDGTGIRKAAPVAPRAAAGAQKPGDSSVKPFLGGGVEGTGIRKAAPVVPKEAAAVSAKKSGHS